MRLTRKNPNGSYRIQMSTQKTLRLEWQQEELTVFGEVANLLGAYEDLGTPEELRELISMHKGIKKMICTLQCTDQKNHVLRTKITIYILPSGGHNVNSLQEKSCFYLTFFTGGTAPYST